MQNEHTQTAMAHQEAIRRIVGCDQEAWVKQRLATTIKMAAAVERQRSCGAEAIIGECAIEGIINGAAIEIIRTLGLEPEFVNLRRPAPSPNAGAPIGRPVTAPAGCGVARQTVKPFYRSQEGAESTAAQVINCTSTHCAICGEPITYGFCDECHGNKTP